MTQIPQQPIVQAKLQPNIYTVLLIIAIVALGVTVGVAIWNLTTVYGLSFGEIFQPLKTTTGA